MNALETGYRWRPAEPGDIAAIYDIQCIAHPDHPEGRDVLLERIVLCRRGCLVLEGNGAIAGYVLSHPWSRRNPPPIDTRLGAIPALAEIWYLHDLALLPAARGSGAAAMAATLLAEEARKCGYQAMALVSVNGSQLFWERQGFSVRMDPALAVKLESYGGKAIYMERELATGER